MNNKFYLVKGKKLLLLSESKKGINLFEEWNEIISVDAITFN